MPKPHQISVIMPHYNDLQGLDACLAALERQSLPRGRFEIIVVDNASPCGASAVETAIAGRALLVVEHERGAGPARNRGVVEARHPLLAFIDSDCIPDDGWLEAGTAALDRADMVGGAVSVSVRNPGSRSGAEAFEQVFAFDNRRYVEAERFSVTANLFVRRELFGRIGGFRNGVSEDTDWCRRAVDAGCSIIFEERARVSHPARVDWSQLVGKWRRIHLESFALAVERPMGRLRWLVRSFAILLSIPVHAAQILVSPRLDNVMERAQALATLVRLRLWRFLDAQRLGWFLLAVPDRPVPWLPIEPKTIKVET